MHTLRNVALVGLAFGLAACGSSHMVQVPPKVDLSQLGTVGLIEIAGAPERELGAKANRQFLTVIQSAQPGVPVLELGERAKVLDEIHAGDLDPAAARALGEKHGVDVILWGVLETKEVRPKVSLGTGLESLSAKAEIEGSLLAKLIDTKTGATLWTSAASDRRTLASVSVSGSGISGSGSMDTDAPREELVQALVQRATHDLRPTWMRVRDE